MEPPDFYSNVQKRNQHQAQQQSGGFHPDISSQNYSGGGYPGSSSWQSSNFSPYDSYGASQPQQSGYNPYAKTSANQFGGGNTFGDPPSTSSTSGNFLGSPMQNFPAAAMMSDPMVSAATDYGRQFAEQQKEKISKYVSVSRLKYYFQVDNAYVGKKLGLLLFPFAHTDWSVKWDSGEEPVPPRLDVNAPDLYIPIMAIVTYVLVVGFVLGTQKRFTPEQLGATTSNALAVVIFENLLILLTKYAMNISQALSFYHTLAFSSYKFVGMTVSLLVFLVGGKSGYYMALAYLAGAIAFFLMRTVKVFVLDASSGLEDGTKRKLYLLLFISLTQPLIMWWLTSSVTSYTELLGRPFLPGFGGAGRGIPDDRGATIPPDMLAKDGVKL